MKYKSTRDNEKFFQLSECILLGLAPDGGLFIPTEFPKFSLQEFSNFSSYPEFSTHLISAFCGDDPILELISEISSEAFQFELPLKKINSNCQILELFHGPTNAFKDFGARFLASCLTEMNAEKKLILVATSGDTGGAVASAFYKKENCQVAVLFPKNGVSQRQIHQLSGWGENILSLAVDGNFDDCQNLVKKMFSQKKISKHLLTSANSINIARILPQMSYFAYTASKYFKCYQRAPSFIVPTGNMGNVLGAVWARLCGFPIHKIIFATNANSTIVDYFESGQYNPQPSITTLANAMDVGAPSNMERLLALPDRAEEITQYSSAYSVSDNDIEQSIKDSFDKLDYIPCPHTATALFVQNNLNIPDAIVVATAHPAKFDGIVEPLIGQDVPCPPQLEGFRTRSLDHILIENSLDQLSFQLARHLKKVSP